MDRYNKQQLTSHKQQNLIIIIDDDIDLKRIVVYTNAMSSKCWDVRLPGQKKSTHPSNRRTSYTPDPDSLFGEHLFDDRSRRFLIESIVRRNEERLADIREGQFRKTAARNGSFRSGDDLDPDSLLGQLADCNRRNWAERRAEEVKEQVRLQAAQIRAFRAGQAPAPDFLLPLLNTGDRRNLGNSIGGREAERISDRRKDQVRAEAAPIRSCRSGLSYYVSDPNSLFGDLLLDDCSRRFLEESIVSRDEERFANIRNDAHHRSLCSGDAPDPDTLLGDFQYHAWSRRNLEKCTSRRDAERIMEIREGQFCGKAEQIPSCHSGDAPDPDSLELQLDNCILPPPAAGSPRKWWLVLYVAYSIVLFSSYSWKTHRPFANPSSAFGTEAVHVSTAVVRYRSKSTALVIPPSASKMQIAVCTAGSKVGLPPYRAVAKMHAKKSQFSRYLNMLLQLPCRCFNVACDGWPIKSRHTEVSDGLLFIFFDKTCRWLLLMWNGRPWRGRPPRNLSPLLQLPCHCFHVACDGWPIKSRHTEVSDQLFFNFFDKTCRWLLLMWNGRPRRGRPPRNLSPHCTYFVMRNQLCKLKTSTRPEFASKPQ